MERESKHPMENGISGKKSRRKYTALSRHPLFLISIAPPGAHPHLEKNPGNPFTQMDDDERVEDIVETLGLLCAQTCLERSLKDGPRLPDDAC